MQAKLIQSYCLDARTVLEIGCGRGLLLALLRSFGFDVYGIEPSKAAAEYCNRFSIPTHNSYFSKSFNHQEQMDIVILSHVLEHVSNPKSFLIDIVNSVRPKYLLLIQANYYSITARLQKEDWYAWAPDQHYFHFSVDGLNRMATSLGLKLVKNEYSELNSKRIYAYMQTLLFPILPRCKDQFHSLFQI
jgi:SAM-dependent methyltransferase